MEISLNYKDNMIYEDKYSLIDEEYNVYATLSTFTRCGEENPHVAIIEGTKTRNEFENILSQFREGLPWIKSVLTLRPEDGKYINLSLIKEWVR